MNKITVIGDTSSGKTCFLYAMYNFIALGYVDGFTMSAKSDQQDVELQDMYETLADSSLGEDRFPAATPNREVYEFSLQYGFKEIASFQWSDYPGSFITGRGEGSQDFVNDLESSDAWVIFVDGEKLCDVFMGRRDLMDVCGKYNRFITRNSKGIIPASVPIIVTKSDIIVNEIMRLGKSAEEAFSEIENLVKKGFSALFAETNDSLKSISVVTLGDELMNDGYKGRLDPVNIEYPITLSMLSILNHNFDRLFSRILELRHLINKDREKFFSSKVRRDQWQAQIDEIRPQLTEWQTMVEAIFSTLDNSKKLWKKGEELNLKEYYAKEFLIERK